MKLTIRTRLVLAMNLLVVGVGVAVGWAGVEVTGNAIEHRLVDESARNAAGLYGTLHVSFSGESSEQIMRGLQQILGAEAAVGPTSGSTIIAASLPPLQAQALRDLLAAGPLPRRVTLDRQTYLVGVARTAEPETVRPAGSPLLLYLLVPEAQVAAAQKASKQTIVLVTLLAILLATALAYWLSATISRPIGDLANRMDIMASQTAEETLPAQRDGPLTAGPPELLRLSQSFDTLVGRLAEAHQKLARSSRLAAVGQLSASVAHELKNPLSGIKMNAQVLAEEMTKAGLSDTGLDRIIKEADRMNVYLEELLGLATEEVKPEPPHNLRALPRVSLEAVCDSVLALIERRCQHGGIKVHRHRGDAAEVRANETQIRQVVLNLVLNAIDAMPGGGSLTLSVVAAEGSAVAADADTAAADGIDIRAIRFSVTDTGQGVHVPAGKNIFEPFTTTKPGGVGLGLYICRRNIERHHGRIGYDSSDRGTTFWFELPAAD